ncbi:hypothetical protein [Eggerthella sinensis]|uniref:hypothetical protein n=1 Tax=Eggerthella sinensis TaxID=242230 RepID=UPI0022E6EFE3|nr:hypothetical protein [Eggerthella sinensis]
MATYTQAEKNIARNTILSHAVSSLTCNRSNAACVRQTYVSDLRNYFLEDAGSPNALEASKIDNSYIAEWVRLRQVCIGKKDPDDLKVCYLSGPEPKNDFDTLVSLGVLPQNIWAFESNNATFSRALEQCRKSGYSQPKLIKESIEKFFETTPIEFDIVYLDACSTLISSKNTLRCIATLFRFHRLCSPGVLIVNTCMPDKNNPDELGSYASLMAKYFITKKNPGSRLDYTKHSLLLDQFAEIENSIKKDFDDYYSEFITSITCNSASVVCPALRFANSKLSDFICDPIVDELDASHVSIQLLNQLDTDSLARFFAASRATAEGCLFGDDGKIRLIERQLAGASPQSINVSDALILSNMIRSGRRPLKRTTKEIASRFKAREMHQFLDEPHSGLYVDFALRQLSYPMHYCAHSSKRITYVAQTKRMMMDSIVFDECRYIYDYLPAAYQIDDAIDDLSWQYVFRFALDGLVKQRMTYDSDFFFKGSVVHDTADKFSKQNFTERERIN